MRRAAWIAAAAIAGATLILGLVVAGRDGTEPGRHAPAAVAPSSTSTTPPAQERAPSTLLVWTSGGLPPGFGEQVGALEDVERLTLVSGDLVDVTASFDASGRAVDTVPAGMRIPLDAIAVDPASYPSFVDEGSREVLRSLEPGETVLGATSARLRRLAAGGVLELAGERRLTVAGIVPDEAVGAAELVVASPDATIATPRFLLVAYSGARPAIEEAISALAPSTRVRFRAPGEARFLRHADLVLPQALVKEQFGEFAYAPGADRFVVVDTSFTAEYVVTETVPILGAVTCHRAVIPALAGALGELEALGLGSLVDPAGYQGCYVPSVIPGSGGLSRHSWGIAVDVNFLPNATGLPSFADARLIEVMDRWGFVSGAQFLETDPGHFEYVQAPA